MSRPQTEIDRIIQGRREAAERNAEPREAGVMPPAISDLAGAMQMEMILSSTAWVIPSVNYLVLAAYGGGGGGGGRSYEQEVGEMSFTTPGGGGAAGQMVLALIKGIGVSLTGRTLNVVIGEGGAAGDPEVDGSAGGETTVIDNDPTKLSITAKGGVGGWNGSRTFGPGTGASAGGMSGFASGELCDWSILNVGAPGMNGNGATPNTGIGGVGGVPAFGPLAKSDVSGTIGDGGRGSNSGGAFSATQGRPGAVLVFYSPAV